MNYELITIDSTQELVKNTLEIVNTAVGSTMGPNGRLALIGVGTSSKVTKDGVTVAKAIKFSDPRMELINRIITEPAVKTDHECGDGTTTTIFLTEQLYSILSEFTSFKDQKFIESIIDDVIVQLSKDSIKVTMDSPLLKNLALTSSNSDELLADLVTQIYKDGNGKFPEIEIKQGVDSEDRIARSSGLPLKLHFSNPGFSKSGNGDDTEYSKPIVLIIDNNVRVSDNDELLKALSKFNTDKENTYLLVARSFDNDVNVLISQINNSEQRRKFIPLQTNMGGSVGTLLMQDLATVFNTPLLTSVKEISTKTFFNSQDKVTVGNTRSLLEVLSKDTTARIQARVKSIEGELNEYEGGERFSFRARFNETRIRNLNGELVTIFVGGETISDVKERVDRFEDVIKAVKSALINGVLPGMSTALITAGGKVLNERRKLLDAKQNPTLNDLIKSALSDNSPRILNDLEQAFKAQYVKLVETSKISLHELTSLESGWAAVDLAPRLCVNLTTDEIGTAEELGIYDTAYASITALKGGFKTAKILANLNTVLLGDKLGMVKVN